MQIVTDKEPLVNMFAVALFAVVGNDYQVAKDCVNEILDNIGYTPLSKGHGRLIDADKLRDKCQKEYDFYVEAYGGFENMSENDKARADHIMSVIADIVNAETIIEADKENKK